MGTFVTRKTDDINKVREYIKACIVEKFGTYTAYAEKEEVSLQYVCNVMSGTKPIPAWMYKRFKINHVVTEHWEVEVPVKAPKAEAAKPEPKAAKPEPKAPEKTPKAGAKLAKKPAPKAEAATAAA